MKKKGRHDIHRYMRWNPIINAFAAALYIWGIGLLVHHIASLHHDTPDNLAGSVTAISLVVFSAAVMGFLFFYRPVMLLVEQKKAEAISFFLKMLGVFGLITIVMVFVIL
jgi:hypothetical protein